METFAPLIRSHGEGGHVINVASLAGMVAPPRMEPYTATKFAVVAMSEGWAQQLAPHGIGVSVLCPGFARTRIHESFRNKPAKYGAAETASGLGQSREEGAALVNGGIDPDIVGDRVVEAMKAGELYIFTHREAQAFLELRFQGIIDAYKRAKNSEVLKRLPDVDMTAVMQQLQAQQFMIADFAGKTAVITGGASGIGFGLARAFARRGMNVMLLDREAEPLAAAVETLKAMQAKAVGAVADVADLAAMKDAQTRTEAEFGPVHILCNNAGVGGGGPLRRHGARGLEVGARRQSERRLQRACGIPARDEGPWAGRAYRQYRLHGGPDRHGGRCLCGHEVRGRWHEPGPA